MDWKLKYHTFGIKMESSYRVEFTKNGGSKHRYLFEIKGTKLQVMRLNKVWHLPVIDYYAAYKTNAVRLYTLT